ncbi:MAG: leucyl aminopeptidase [Candidatus Omnitrophica bacterium]|nr:leucyl aminopeptidase [Candidatus Omnitrophota bacterium]
MKSSAVLRDEIKKKPGALVLGFFEGEREIPASIGKLDAAHQDFFDGLFRAKRFEGKDKQIFFSFLPALKSAQSVFLAGLGKKDQYTLEKFRGVVGRVVKQAAAHHLAALSFDVKSLAPQKASSHDIGRAVSEASLLASFRFDKYKTGAAQKADHDLKNLDLVCDELLEKKEMQAGIKFGRLVGEAVNLARTLSSEPANQMTPEILAARAREAAEDAGLICQVLDRDEIKELKMGGLLGVAQGSSEPPKFIILETPYENPSQKPVVLVGKGITFDSGGISLKPPEGMEKMKYDMSGAASVIATVWLAGKLKLPVKVIGLAPTCENLPSEKPQRPGDIVTISNGKTVEVINTDAEGRLILADGLSYGVNLKPRYLIDIATLTGSCRATFGEYAIGVMGTNRNLLDSLREAGEKSGERTWELPLWDEYKDHVRSDFADLKNVGKGLAGAIIGGKFLEEFTGGVPWAHLDIASTGWFEEHHAYLAKGATGAGVRLLIQFLKDLT